MQTPGVGVVIGFVVLVIGRMHGHVEPGVKVGHLERGKGRIRALVAVGAPSPGFRLGNGVTRQHAEPNGCVELRGRLSQPPSRRSAT